MTATALVVFSGGMDSTSLVAYVRDAERAAPLLVSFDYGQRHRRELKSATQIAGLMDMEHLVVPMQAVGALLGGSALTDDTVDVPDGHYTDQSMSATVVPNRNAILCNIAAGIAGARGIDRVYIGVHSGDHAVYPDCRPEFVDALNASLVRAFDGRGPTVIAPFVRMFKSDIARIGYALGAPLDLSWSCYKGGTVHCGRCGTCVERAEAFHEAKVEDRTSYEDRDFWWQATGTVR